MNNNILRFPSIMPDRVLLINSPAYDIRLPWDKWQQPTQLLRLATYFRRLGSDVQLFDSLYVKSSETLHRKRVDILDVDGLKVPKWRYGISASTLVKTLNELAKSGWKPDEVYVECFTTFWWEGAAEVIGIVKKIFPLANIALLGAYSTLAPEHAKINTLADEDVPKPWHDIDCLPADLSLYPEPPLFSYLTLGQGKRSADEVLAEIQEAVKLGVKAFVFAEDLVARQHPDLYSAVLDKIASSMMKVKLYALGNIAPQDLVQQPRLAHLMKAAGYVQIWLADDRYSPITSTVDEQLIENYKKVSKLCHEAGFRQRTDEIIAAVCIGRLGEDLSERAELATLAAHHIGSVIFWAYQPELSECTEILLENQNGKMFPLRQQNNRNYREYLDVLGLAAVLNAKYRATTFDFMGAGLIANLFRSSMERRAWEPEPEVKGSLQLPMKVRN